MAITAELDCIGRDKSGYVAYVKFLRDGVLVETMDVRYDPDKEDAFKTAVGDRIIALSDTIKTLEAKASKTLASVVSVKQAEIASKEGK